MAASKLCMSSLMVVAVDAMTSRLLSVAKQHSSQKIEMPTSAAGRTLMALDTNHDGFVDPKEVAEFARIQGLDAVAVTQEFMNIDKNADGRLAMDEIASALDGNGQGVGAQVPVDKQASALQEESAVHVDGKKAKREERKAQKKEERRQERKDALKDQKHQGRHKVDAKVDDQAEVQAETQAEAPLVSLASDAAIPVFQSVDISEPLAAARAEWTDKKEAERKEAEQKALPVGEDAEPKAIARSLKTKRPEARLEDGPISSDVKDGDVTAFVSSDVDSSVGVGAEAASAEGSYSGLLQREEAWEAEAQLLDQRASELRLNASLLAKSTARLAIEAGARAAREKSKDILKSLSKLESGAKKAEVTAAALRAKAQTEVEEAQDLMVAADSVLGVSNPV